MEGHDWNGYDFAYDTMIMISF